VVKSVVEQTPEAPSAGPIKSLPGWLQVRPRFEVIALGLLVVVASWIAWQGRFIQDDAFISFRYARHLAAGEGLVWNPGERVEGYSNFLWVLIMTIPHLMGIDVVVFSQAVGVLLFATALILTWRTFRDLGGRGSTALVTVLLLGTNYSFLRWAGGGMETALQAVLGLACARQAILGIGERRWPVSRLLAISALAALAILTRLDSALIVGVPIIVASIYALLIRRSVRGRIWCISMLSLPVVAIVGAWTLWRVSYYGDLLPNTYYVKVASNSSIRLGLQYLLLFLREYLLFPFVFLVVVAVPRLVRRRSVSWLLLLGITSLWCGYLARVGGDFMEFRLIAPIMPMAILLIGWTFEELLGSREARLALAMLIMFGSIYHAYTFRPPAPSGGVESIRELETHLEPDQGWDDVGMTLRQAFFDSQSVSIAANPVGAIAYYSELATIDMLGLNDLWIARNGPIVTAQPGHQRRATLSYLLGRRVNLVFGVPWVVWSDDQLSDLDLGPEVAESFMGGGSMDVPVPAGTSIVRIPLGTDRDVLAWYLTASPEVDLAIVRLGWHTYPVWGSQEVPTGLRPVGLARTCPCEVTGGWSADPLWSAGGTAWDGRGT
jgi:arabinofuranosyltransferase